MSINWGTCGDDRHWCYFGKLILSSEDFKYKKGYIVWSGETVIRLGSGLIKDRIAAHREDFKISKYTDMKVTWAKVNANRIQGVEKYLADILNPVVGDRFPDRIPIEVNLTWD